MNIRRFEQLRGISSIIYTTIPPPLSVWSSVAKPPIINWLLIMNWLLVSETIRISILPLTPSAKRSTLFLIEFVSMYAMIMLFIFLTLNVFSLVVRSCSSDSQVAETGNGRLSFEGLFLHSGDSLRIGNRNCYLHLYRYR